MKYSPRKLKKNVNISHTSPVKDFILLLSGISCVIIIVYFALGLMVNVVVIRLPVKVEESLGLVFRQFYENAKNDEASRKLQGLLDKLAAGFPEKDREFRVHLVENTMVNAVALPGGNIVVFTGLMKEVASEEEISFVLAHELGHFANHDHLKGLGRGLLLWTLSAVFLGNDNSVTDLAGQSLMGVQMKFSQAQETKADLFALELMCKQFGHVAGAVAFMRKIALTEKEGLLAYYFSTHPHPQKRIKVIQHEIRSRGYNTEGTEHGY
jgi:Zn-dependent protease with chaperone function